MSINVQIEARGIRDVQKALAGVRDSVKKRILRSAMTYAVRPLKPAVAADAPSTFGALRRSIGIKIKNYKGAVFAAVGPLTKYKERVAGTFPFRDGSKAAKQRVQQPSKIAHLIEGGTKPHFIPAPGYGRTGAKRGTAVGKTPGWEHHGTKPNPFIAPTGRRMQPSTLQRFRDHVLKRVHIEFQKAAAKGRKFWSTDK